MCTEWYSACVPNDTVHVYRMIRYCAVCTMHVYRMVTICGRDIKNVIHSDRLLASSWFVRGIWESYNYIKAATIKAPLRSTYEMCSSGILHSVEWQFPTDLWRHHIGPVSNVQKFLL